MSFRTQLVADAKNVFCDLAVFGEEITYTPSGGSPKTVRAVVEREPASPDSQIRDLQGKSITLSIPNDATLGVTSITRKFDAVTVAAVIGGTPEVFMVMEILNTDEGMWRVSARR